MFQEKEIRTEKFNSSSVPGCDKKSGNLLPLLLACDVDLKEILFSTLLQFLRKHKKLKSIFLCPSDSNPRGKWFIPVGGC